jgi:hypothetical protein
VNLLLITGSMGAGKTTTLGEASDLLAQHAVPHAAIDLDGLGLWHSPHPADALWVDNLRCVSANYATAGIDRLLIAAAVETADDLEAVIEATGAASVAVCRLRAPLEVMESRVLARECGVQSAYYVSRVRILDRILDESGLEHFSVDTTQSVTGAARELLQRAGWIA